jgi:hypothetical protein
MEEAAENGKELSYSANGNGMNDKGLSLPFISAIVLDLRP